MDQCLKVQSSAAKSDTRETDAERDERNESKPGWHAPVITRIDIKRTMNLKGSGSDSVGRTGTSSPT